MKKLILTVAVALFITSCSKKEEETITQVLNQTQNPSISGYQKTDFYFKLPSKDGETIDLANYKGRPVMILFFTENCPYCIKSAPFLEKLYEKYTPQGLGVIGISIKDDIQSPIEFQRRTGIKFPLVYNGKEIARNYGISGVPFIYLLDKNHNLKRVWAGYSEEYNEDIIRTIEKTI